jgi:hypothetical protein
VVISGFSTSLMLLPLLATLLLLVGVALPWMNDRMNDRTRADASQPLLVLPLAGVCCPVDSLLWLPAVPTARLPARAPPTSPSDSPAPDKMNPGSLLMVHVAHLLTDFR